MYWYERSVSCQAFGRRKVVVDMLSDILGSLDRKKRKQMWEEVRWNESAHPLKSNSAHGEAGQASLPVPRPLLHSVLKVSLRWSLTPSLTHICLQLALVTYRLERNRNVGTCSGLSRCRSSTSSFVAYKLFLMTKDTTFQPEFRLGPLEAAIIATSWVKVPSEPLGPEEQATVNPVTLKCSRNRTCECSCQQPSGCKYIHSFQTNLIGLPGPGTSAMGREQERGFLFSQCFRPQVCEPGIWALGPTLPLTCLMSYVPVGIVAQCTRITSRA